MDSKVADQIKARIRHTAESTTPFMSRSHTLALNALEQSVNEEQGIAVIVGETGMGKSTVLAEFLRRPDHQSITMVQLEKTPLSFDDILVALAAELGLSSHSVDVPEIHQALIGAYLAGRRLGLILDDAHLISVEVLAQLPTLAGLESAGTRLLQIVMLGRPELSETMDHPALQALLPHIAVAAQLSPLAEDECAAFIRHQLQGVVETHKLFHKSALTCLSQYAGGVPRDLNILSTDVINVGLAEHKTPIRARMVKDVLRDYAPPAQSRLRIPFRLPLPSRVVTGAAAAVVLAMVGLGALSFYNRQPAPAIAQAITSERPAATTTQPVPTQPVGAETGSEQVRDLQQRLAEAGFDPGPIDGIMGPQTELALRQYQAANAVNGSKQLRRATHKDVRL